MCRADGCDMASVYSERDQTARRDHKCSECGRAISPGELYQRVFAVSNGDALDMKLCAHCVVAKNWIIDNCGGWVFGEVREEIEEHADEYPAIRWPLLWIAVGMRRGWRAFGATARMRVPPEPPSIASVVGGRA